MMQRSAFSEFEYALKRNLPMFWIPEGKDKEKFPYWVHLHPVVVKWVKPVIVFKALSQTDKNIPMTKLEAL